jgi:hypothetical protein
MLVQGAAEAAAALARDAKRVSAQQTPRARRLPALCELSREEFAIIFHHKVTRYLVLNIDCG